MNNTENMDTSSNLNETFSSQNDTTINQRPTQKKVIKAHANYFDINDILSLNERIACKIDQDLIKMGYLDPSTDDEHLPKGTKLELPMWFAKVFYDNELIQIESPKGYDEVYRQIFNADPTVIDLNRISPNFYKFGEHLVNLRFKESPDISEMLINTFKERIHLILKYAMNIKTEFVDDGINFKKKLDNLETNLYNLIKKDLYHLEKWEKNQLSKIETNELVINLKKRRKAANTAGLYKV